MNTNVAFFVGNVPQRFDFGAYVYPDEDEDPIDATSPLMVAFELNGYDEEMSRWIVLPEAVPVADLPAAMRAAEPSSLEENLWQALQTACASIAESGLSKANALVCLWEPDDYSTPYEKIRRVIPESPFVYAGQFDEMGHDTTRTPAADEALARHEAETRRKSEEMWSRLGFDRNALLAADKKKDKPK